MHNFYFKFLGIAVTPIEIEDNVYVNCWGQTRCIMGDVQMAMPADQRIDQFSFVCSVAWPLNRSEDGSDLALLQAFLFLHIFTSWLA